jgi:hypothetical protein
MKAEPSLTNPSLSATSRILRTLARSGAFLLLVFGGLGFALLLLRPSSGALALFGIPAAAASGAAWATLVALRKDRPKRKSLYLVAVSLNVVLLAFGVFLGVTAEEPWSILFRPLGALFAIGGFLGAAGALRHLWLTREKQGPLPESLT